MIRPPWKQHILEQANRLRQGQLAPALPLKRPGSQIRATWVVLLSLFEGPLYQAAAPCPYLLPQSLTRLKLLLQLEAARRVFKLSSSFQNMECGLGRSKWGRLQQHTAPGTALPLRCGSAGGGCG